MTTGGERVPHPRGGHLAADLDRRDPGVALGYVHGFGSDRTGAKADAFRSRAREEGWTFLSFDARGHGQSSGEIADLTLSGLVEDLEVATAALLPPRATLLLAGSSLGALAAAWFAAERPGRVRATVLVAPAFRFLERFLREVGPERAEAWRREGVLRYRNEWLDVPLRWTLAEDAGRRDDEALARAYATDTLVLHGLRDERVPWEESVSFAARCAHRPLDVFLLADGDHRLQGRASDLARLGGDFLRSRLGAS